MGIQSAVKNVTMTSFDSAVLLVTFLPINTAGLSDACFLIRITNDSTVDIILSYDGTNDHDIILAGTVIEIASQTNSRPNNIAQIAQGTIVYVRGAAAGVGLIYLAGYYQPVT